MYGTLSGSGQSPGPGQLLPLPPAARLQQSGGWLSVGGWGAYGLSGAPHRVNGGLVFPEHCAEEGKAMALHPGPHWEVPPGKHQASSV